MSFPFAYLLAYKKKRTFATFLLNEICKFPLMVNKFGVHNEKAHVQDINDIFDVIRSLSDRQETPENFKTWFQTMFLLHSISDPSIMMTILQMNGHAMNGPKSTDIQGTERVPMFLYWLRNTKWLSKTQHIAMDVIVDNIMERDNLVVSGVDTAYNDQVSGVTYTFKQLADFNDSNDLTRNWQDEFFAEQYEIFRLYSEDILRIQDVSALHQTILNVAEAKYGWYDNYSLTLGIMIDHSQLGITEDQMIRHQITKQIELSQIF